MKSFQYFQPPLPPNASIFARFWRWMKRIVSNVAIGLLSLLVLFFLWASFGPKFTPTDRSGERTIEAGPTSPTAKRSSKPLPASTGDKPFQESEAEKNYEKATGKEVVHKKDGTTYERKQPARGAASARNDR